MDLIVHSLSSYPDADVNLKMDTDPVAKFEIMDGAPVRGESIPIRLFLAGHDLAPTMRDVSKKFSVRYLLNLVLVDEEDRRYFKQREVTLWRKADKPVRKIFEPATVDASTNGLEDTAKANVAGDHANGRDVTADDEQ
ncbi:unnamed protein product [Cylicocyclus nassatus]|uniref:Uncharacterized protein n=1 Tax=Cylicocyclus nassatus TaxID=53992 RepID=A0AA36M7K6_CYLNA|nr:unnamed protein product [Cylicocyclus nassatus]